MKTISRYILTLVALLAVTTGAWAEEEVLLTTVTATGMSTYSQSPDGVVTVVVSGNDTYDADWGWYRLDEGTATITVTAAEGYTITRCVFKQYPSDNPNRVLEDDQAPFVMTINGAGIGFGSCFVEASNGQRNGPGSMDGASVIEVYGTAAPAIEVTPVTNKTNEWEFDMPASDVVLTPVYSAATVYTFNGQAISETPYETLKEAFAKVQDGDVIKLDWNVTLTEHLETPTIEGGVKFTLDFNGYTIDGGTTYKIQHKNAGDQLTFTDSSVDQLGGLIAKGISIVAGSKFVFDAGRYNFSGATAETINGLSGNTSFPFSLAEGKEFVDLEGGAAANDGFTLRVGFKTFELTIGPKKFATFYMDQNITLADGTDANIGLYTINGEGIDLDNNTVTVTKVNDPIALAGMPLLVYNGTTEQKTVTLKVTPVAPSASQMWSTHFQGTAVDKTFDADDMAANDYYVLSGGSAFAPVKGTGTIGANKCWLEFAKQQTPGARQLTIVFDNDETTGVNEVIEVNEVSDDTLYDLNGRKLNAKPTRKGVYIKNGQKVVIK